MKSNDVTKELITTLTKLTDEQQFFILKELVKDDVLNYLLGQVTKFSKEKKRNFLTTIDRINFSNLNPKNGEHLYEEPLYEDHFNEDKSVAIDLDSRGQKRAKCDVAVKFSANGKSFIQKAHNISSGGIKLGKPDETLRGQKLKLNFSLPGYSQSFQTSGIIVQENDESIGIQFIDMPLRTEAIINAIIETMK